MGMPFPGGALGGESNTILELLLVLGHLLEIRAMDGEGPSKIVGKVARPQFFRRQLRQ